MHRPSIYKVFWVKVTVTFGAYANHWVSWQHFYMLQFLQYKFHSNWQSGFMFPCVLNQGGQCVFISYLLREKKGIKYLWEMHAGKNLWEDFEFTIVVSFTWAAVVLCKEKLWVHILSRVLGGKKKVSDVFSSRFLVSRDSNISTWEIDSGTTSGPSWGPWTPRAAVGV